MISKSLAKSILDIDDNQMNRLIDKGFLIEINGKISSRSVQRLKNKLQKVSIDSLIPTRKTGLEKFGDFLKREGANVF